ncbi:MAG: hypothetical protein H7145_19250 [Akkermansiaceae bacterium]|nr:hypothetical protein [Armatimonadota bacterium]
MNRTKIFSVLALAAFALPLAATAQNTKTTSPVAAPPSNIVMFPPMLEGANPDGKGEVNKSARNAQTLITDALKSRLTMAGVGAFVYSRRLPTVQRAVAESLIKAENAANPTDDERVAQRVAEVMGADEYVIVDVPDYKYDAATRTATFTVSLIRKAVDGTQLGTVAEKAIGVAPEDVAANRQEGSAVARAAETVAEQTVNALFPMPKVETKKKK